MIREDCILSDLLYEEDLPDFLSFSKNNKEYIIETTRPTVLIPDRYFIFRINDKENENPYTHMCRISMNEPKFMGLEFETWVPEENNILFLIEFLNQSIDQECMGLTHFDTVWSYILYSLLRDTGDSGYISLGLPMPDYTKLITDKKPKYNLDDIYVEKNDILCLSYEYFWNDKVKEEYCILFPLCNSDADYFGLAKYSDCIDKNTICWISMSEPRYIYREKGLWTPSKQILEDFIENLGCEARCEPYFDKEFDTLWAMLCTRFKGKVFHSDYCCLDKPMPDYTKLLEKKISV